MKREEAKTVSGNRIPGLVIVCALFVFLASGLLSLLVFQRSPHIHDEIAYLFQAKIFASGHLTAPSPCFREAFDFPHIICNGRWYSQYPPGYPLLLVPAMVAGTPWLLNPLLAALAIILFYLLGKEIYGERVGRLAALLGAASIWLVLMSATMMSHTSGMLFFALFLLFLFKSEKFPSILNGLVAGVGLGMAVLIRPYEAVLISLPFLVWYGIRFLKSPKMNWKNVAAFVVAGAVFAAVFLLYNQATNGNPLKMGYVVKYGEAHSVGFGKAGYTGSAHNPDSGFVQTGRNLYSLNRYLFGWPLTSLLFLLPLAFPAGVFRKKERNSDLLLLAGIFSLLVGLFFYWGAYAFLGARFLFNAVPILILLSAAGFARAPVLLVRFFPKSRIHKIEKWLFVMVTGFVVFAYAFTLPRWIQPPDDKGFFSVLSDNYAGTTPFLHETLRRLPLGKAIVVMKLLYLPQRYFPTGGWGSGFMNNDPELAAPVIYAAHQGAEDIKFFDCFPDRNIYLYWGTLERGFLVPVRRGNGRLVYGRPIVSSPTVKSGVELVASPLEVFRLYSDAFRGFLAKTQTNNPFPEIDVGLLDGLARQAETERNFETAAYCLEAALQVEQDPDFRLVALGRLAVCYSRMGKRGEAQRILDRIDWGLKPIPVFDVAPEKGF